MKLLQQKIREKDQDKARQNKIKNKAVLEMMMK